MRGKPFVFRDLQGGFDPDALNQVAPAIDGRARQAINVVPREAGGVRKRYGFSLMSTLPATINTVAFLEFATSGYFMVFTTSELYPVDASDGTFGASIRGALTLGGFWSCIQAPIVTGGAPTPQGPFYAMNGSQPPIQWTGTGNAGLWNATAGSVPNGKLMTYHGNRVWVAGVSATPQRLFFSSLGNPRDWSSTPPSDGGFVDIEPNDGEPITAIGEVGSYLLVFKRRKVYLVYDLNTGANRALTDAVGCDDPRTVVETPYGTVFLAVGKANNLGFALTTPYITNGQSVTPLEPRLDLVNTAKPVTTPQGIYMNGCYYIGAGLGNPADESTFVSPEAVILAYDFRHKSWWKHMIGAAGSNRTVQTMAIGRDTTNNGEPYLVMAERATAKLFRAFDSLVRTDDGASFYWEYTSPFHALKNQFVEKRIHELRVDGRGPINVACAAFPADPLVAASEVPYETQSATDPSERVFYTPCDGRMVSVRFSDTSSVDAEVDGYAILADYRER